MAYFHITQTERKQIRALRQNGRSLKDIARHLSRNKSTISRELRRNCNPGAKYDAVIAHRRAGRRRRDAKRPQLLVRQSCLQQYVIKSAKRGYSPEQIAARWHLESGEKSFSFRSVYRFLYQLQLGRRPLVGPLVRCPRKRRKKSRMRRRIIGRQGIELRPAEVDERNAIGHWEGDTICAAPGNGQVLVFTERYSRFTFLLRLASRHAPHVAAIAKRLFKRLPKSKRSTLTMDNGLEFAEFPRLQGPLQGFQTYYCDPHSPWQRGTVENTNGLLRQYLPKHKPLNNLSQAELNRYADALNQRPRKCLNWRTPAEIFKPG